MHMCVTATIAAKYQPRNCDGLLPNAERVAKRVKSNIDEVPPKSPARASLEL